MFVVIRAFRNRCRHFIPLCPTPQQNRPQFLPHRPLPSPPLSPPFSPPAQSLKAISRKTKKRSTTSCAPLCANNEKVGGRKWEKFLPDAFEFRKNERECDEHVGAGGVWSQIEVEVTCARNETATIYSGRRKSPFLAAPSTCGLCTRMGRKVFLANMCAADMRVDLRG